MLASACARDFQQAQEMHLIWVFGSGLSHDNSVVSKFLDMQVWAHQILLFAIFRIGEFSDSLSLFFCINA